MNLAEHFQLLRCNSPLPIWQGELDRAGWNAMAHAVSEQGGRLLTLWASETADADDGMRVHAAYASDQGLFSVALTLAANERYPDLAAQYSCAVRLQRAMADLSGVHARAATDTRPWLDHGLWDGSRAPLRTATMPAAAELQRMPSKYAFVRVEGQGVHEIPVGPVHAGIIEPGHFRFSVVGEKVLRLEQRLGYVHKGIERRFCELDPRQAHRLAGRVSGDASVAYAWAYCMALESACTAAVPPRAQWLRALLLERERVANHLGDLGALGNDAALAFGLAQFSRLREDWQRLSAQVFGHRLLMDVVVPGGVAVDASATQLLAMSAQTTSLRREVADLQHIYDEHAGLQDRFITTGRVTPQLAAQLGLTGLAGRASGQARDLRCDFELSPYRELQVRKSGRVQGDVAARVAVRFEELFESLRLIDAICAAMPDGAIGGELQLPAVPALGFGWVESWRGEVLVALHLDAAGSISRCHCHDPSWQNWPVLEHAVIGNIVPDFPLINKSFNLSYSGHDL